MVQILPRTPSLAELLGQGISAGIGSSVQQQQQLAQQQQLMQIQAQQQEALRKQHGSALRAALEKLQNAPIHDQISIFRELSDFPEVAKSLSTALINEKKIPGAQMSPEQLPEPWRGLYNQATVGGKTKIMDLYLDMLQRGEVAGTPPQPKESLDSPSSEIEETDIIGEEVPEKLQNFDRGLTAKERVKREESRYKTQTPLINKLREQLQNFEKEGLLIDRLEQLNESENLPSGFERINVNPQTGDIILPAKSSPEAQLYVKTIKEFLKGAKDTFGSRVTNFDADQFLKGLPTLANSEEGRRLVIRQMKVINQLNHLRDKAVSDVIDRYGIRKIDYDKAEKLAEKKVEGEKKKLLSEYKNLGGLLNREEKEFQKTAKANTPEGHILMKTDKGEYRYTPKDQLKKAIKKGWKKQ